MCNNLFHAVKAINFIDYPLNSCQIMHKIGSFPFITLIHRDISCVAINISSLLIISNEFHDRHLMLVEDVNVLLDICQDQLSKNSRHKKGPLIADLSTSVLLDLEE